MNKILRAKVSDASYKVSSKSAKWFEERGFLKCFTIFGHGNHLGHVTRIMLMNFHFLFLQAYTQNLAENGPVVTDKTSLNFICI